jgi:hypothetical protein
MATRIGKTFILEVRSRKKLRPSASAATVPERTQALTLQDLLHRFSPADQDKLLNHRQAVELNGHFRTPQAEHSRGKGRILLDLTAREAAEVLEEGHPLGKRKSPAARRKAANPAIGTAEPESAAAKAAVQNGQPSVLEGATSAKSVGRSDEHGTVAAAKRKRREVRDRAGESLRPGERWKRRLPKVCW